MNSIVNIFFSERDQNQTFQKVSPLPGMKEFQVKPEIQAFLFSKKPESGFFKSIKILKNR